MSNKYLYQLSTNPNSLIVCPDSNADVSFAKRIFDLLIALPCVLLLSPVILIIAILVMLDSPGNPFFTQIRVGKNGKLFIIFKIRTLFIDQFGIFLEEELVNPGRITRLGKFLRRSKLDELPQLINVALGDMSLVGPRPDIIEQVNNYTDVQRKRLSVKPGLTGLTQISGNNMLSWPHRIWLDIWYIEHRTWFLNLQIIALTFITLFRGETIKADPLNLHKKVPSELK